jgi:hypothetical protein
MIVLSAPSLGLWCRAIRRHNRRFRDATDFLSAATEDILGTNQTVTDVPVVNVRPVSDILAAIIRCARR